MGDALRRRVLVIYTTEAGTGISAKAEKICDGLRCAGCDVELLVLPGGGGAFSRLVALVKVLWSGCRRIVGGSYSLIFIRYAYYFAPLYLVCYLLRRPLQIEVNSNTDAEMRVRGQTARAVLDRLVCGMACRAATRVHAVSRFLSAELARRYPGIDVRFTPNFVVDEYVCKGRARRDAGPCQLVFLGNAAQVWHGIPRFLVALASSAQLRESCRLNLVGRRVPEIDRLVADLGLEDIVVCHGFQAGSEKHRIMCEMHVAISGFALDAIGLKETTGIKIGEYLHAGLPVILGYRDPALGQDLPFVLSVDLQGDVTASVAAIGRFIVEVRQHPEWSDAAHQFAVANLSVRSYVGRLLA